MNFLKRIIEKIFFKFVLKNVLSKGLVKSEESKTNANFCEKVYGKNLSQFNMANMEQLDKLIEILNLNENNKVLDLGCATGTITEYISDLTNAKITGIDYAKGAINKAQERTSNKQNRLSFLQMDMNNLDFHKNSFDAVIAIDTLYFVNNLEKFLKSLKEILIPKGKMAFFYTQTIAKNKSTNMLLAENTKLAVALKKCELNFNFFDFTELEKTHWKISKEVAEQMKNDFEEEGNIQIYYGKIKEANKMLKYVDSERISRYLYEVQL